MLRGYSLSLKRALIVFFIITIGMFALSVAFIRVENSSIGFFWPLFVPVGWLGPAVVASIGIAAYARERQRPMWTTYMASWLASLLWFMVAVLAISLPFTADQNVWQLIGALLHPWVLLWTMLLVIMTLGIDRWIHKPKKTLTAQPRTPKLNLGNPV